MLLTIEDLQPFAAGLDEAKAEAMIADAIALAVRIAPCLAEEGFEHVGAAKAIMRGAVLRWLDSGSGTQPALIAGPFGVTPQAQPRRSLFYPSEIAQLQELCGGGRGQAFTIDTTPPSA